MKPKQELLRVVKPPEGECMIDFRGKASGRGAYVCPDTQCLKKAQKARRFERAFSCRIEDAVYDAMYNELCADTEGGAVKE